MSLWFLTKGRVIYPIDWYTFQLLCGTLFNYYIQKPEFARIVLGAKSLITSNGLLKAFKGSLKPALYNKLIERATYYAPPYLPLEAFSKTLSKDAFSTLSLYEWNDPAIMISFKEFLQAEYPDYTLKDAQQAIRKVIKAANL